MAVIQVSWDQLQFKPFIEKGSFLSTAPLEDLTEPIGQARAIESLRFATELQSTGYNIYALGHAGIGKHQIIEQFLNSKISKSSIPVEWVYLNNFTDPVKPIAVSFSVGQARVFQNEIHQLIEDLRSTIPSLYDSDRYRTKRDQIIKEFKDRQDNAILELESRAKKENAFLLNVHGGLLFAAGDKDGNILEDEAVLKLSKEEQDDLANRISKFNDELVLVVNQFPIQERQMRLKIKELNREMVFATVEASVKELLVKYANHDRVRSYLEDMIRDIVDNARDFRRRLEESPELKEAPSPLKRYEVNVIVDHTTSVGAPIVYEDNPTFMNLVGEIEHLPILGALITDFTLIRPGALHRANGGYLVLDAIKLLTSPYAWEGLKRALKSQFIKIESLGQVYSLVSTVTLKPEPIPLSCKVILIGDLEIYQALIDLDPDFSDLFRVTADFESEIERNETNEKLFIQLLSSLVRKNQLRHLDWSAVVRILEHSTRLVSDRERLSLDLNLLSNLLRESDHFAAENNQELITEPNVQRAIDFQFHRVSRIYEKQIQEIKRGTQLIEVEGQSIGQINALSVYEFANTYFGHPNRISAVVRMGEGQVVDIEREVKMGGPIHSKGVMILSGYLKSKFAEKYPLSISASLVFEQSYSMVEGDSASMAELAALLSVLAQIPLKQNFAMTGSVNQNGQAQAIGGVNEKVEGFFDLCRSKGLKPGQGVIIPNANLKHLSLRKDVQLAIKEGKFSIYSVDSVEDAMTILTGVSVSLLFEKIEERLKYFFESNKKGK